MRISWLKVFLGITAPLLVIGAVVYNAYSGSYKIYVNKHLSIVHSNIERRCEVCHTPWEGVYSDSCYKCHRDECGPYENLLEKEYEDEEFTFSEMCYDCHREHRGRSHNLMAVNKD